MPEDVKKGTATATTTTTGANPGSGAPAAIPGGIGMVDTESSDLDLLGKLVMENNQPAEAEAEAEGDDEADVEGTGEDLAAGGGDGEDDEGDKTGEGGEDGEDGANDTFNAALLEVAKELGFDSLESLSEKQLAKLKELVKVSPETGSGDDDEMDEGDDLTEYERSLLAEDEEEAQGDKGEEKGDGKGEEKEGAKPAAAPEPADIQAFYASLLDGKFKLSYESDADFYEQLNKAAEAKDVKTYEVLQNQRFVERGMKFLKPVLELLVDRKLDTFADLITPALSEYTQVSSQRRVSTARDKAITELESLTVKSGAKPYSGIKQFLTPDQPEKKVVLNGKSFPSSPWTRVLKANPEILNIRVHGKDGKVDQTATFIAQYKAAMKFGRQTSTSSPVTKKVAEKLVSAGVKAGQRQAQRNAGGKLNSNSSGGTGKQAGQDKKDWGKEYRELAHVDGAASWIGS